MLRRRYRDEGHDRRRPDLRRVRLHAGISSGALHARREDYPDLRGHEPDPAGRDRARARTGGRPMTPDGRPLAPGDAARLLESAATAIRAEISALTEGVLGWHPAPGEWCVKEVLGHLIESERRGFNGRIRLMLAGSEPSFEGWDQVEVARARCDCSKSAVALVADFDALRRDSVGLVAGLSAADLGRG